MADSKNTNLFDIKNYNKKLLESEDIITSKYCELITEYIFHLCENIIIQNHEYFIFILIRGLNSLKHIFNTLLLYTKNFELTMYHCKKAYLFYVEFIGQIGDDSHSYLQLNSKDATLFIYKKTIFEINNEYRKQFVLKKEEKEIFEYIHKFSTVVAEIFEEVINNNNIKGNSKISYVMYIQKMTNKIVNKLVCFKAPIKIKINICDNYLYYKSLLLNKNITIDECLFFNLSNLFFKKITNNKTINVKIIKLKLYNPICNYKIQNETPLKFTNWLFNGK
tara:strand:+ start:626 stop:1459 length:834 start_codon:yes stop_codon:yes gene_type:complete